MAGVVGFEPTHDGVRVEYSVTNSFITHELYAIKSGVQESV